MSKNRMKQKSLWLSALGVIILLSAAYYFLYLPRYSPYVIKNGAIYERTLQGKKLLFSQVSNVSAVRKGPDGKTIHFKATSKDRGQALCADPSEPISPVPPDYGEAPPSQAPWDYTKVAWAYTIAGCGDNGNVGGYLRNSDYFAYIKVDANSTTTINLENLKTGKIQIFPIDSVLFKQLLAGREDENLLHYELLPFSGSNNETFYYPTADALAAKGKIMVAFAHLVVAIDPNKDTLIGQPFIIDPAYGIIVNSFWFESQATSPIVIIKSAYEGAPGIDAAYDVSGEKMKTTPLYNLDQPLGFYSFKTPTAEWNERGDLLLHFYKLKDISSLLTRSEQAHLNDLNASDKNVDAIAARFQTTKKYIEVDCTAAGYGEGVCVALVPGNEYIIKPGKDIQQLK